MNRLASRKIGWAAGVLATAGLIALVSSCGLEQKASAGDQAPNNGGDRFAEMQRGDFPITVLATGNLDAIKRHQISYKGRQIKGGLVVRTIVPDRTAVKKGDVLVELAREDAEKEEVKLVESLADAEKKFIQEIEDLDKEYTEKMEDIDRRAGIDKDFLLSDIELLETDYYEAHAKMVQELADAREDYTKTIEDGEIARASDVNKLKSTAESLRTSKEAFEKYENLESRKAKNDLLTGIEKVETQYNAGIAELAKAQDLLAGSQNESEREREQMERAVEEARKKIENAKNAVDIARNSFKNHMQYGHPERLRALSAKLEQAQLSLTQEVMRVKNSVVQSRRTIRNAKAKIMNLEKDLDDLTRERDRKKKKLLFEYDEDLRELKDEAALLTKNHSQTKERITKDYETQKERTEKMLKNLREDMDKLTLKAPADGIVTFGASNRRSYGYSNRESTDIKVGSTISPNQVIGTIPDLSQFVVKSDVPETYRSQLEVGLTASLRSPAVPHLKMSGTVMKIAPMTTNLIRWDSNSPKVYATEITTDTTDPALMPGMTVQLEILVETVTDALFVPIEALYNEQDRIMCKIAKNGDLVPTEVTPGRRSAHFVEIVSGLTPGDRVFLQEEALAGK